MDKKTKFEKTLEQFEEIIFKSGLDHNGRNGQFSSRAAPRLFCAVDSNVIKYLGNMGVKKVKELCPSFKGFYKLAYENKDDCLLYPYKKYYIIEFSFNKHGRVPTAFEQDLFLNPKNEYCILKDILPFCKIEHSALKNINNLFKFIKRHSTLSDSDSPFYIQKYSSIFWGIPIDKKITSSNKSFIKLNYQPIYFGKFNLFEIWDGTSSLTDAFINQDSNKFYFNKGIELINIIKFRLNHLIDENKKLLKDLDDFPIFTDQTFDLLPLRYLNGFKGTYFTRKLNEETKWYNIVRVDRNFLKRIVNSLIFSKVRANDSYYKYASPFSIIIEKIGRLLVGYQNLVNYFEDLRLFLRHPNGYKAFILDTGILEPSSSKANGESKSKSFLKKQLSHLGIKPSEVLIIKRCHSICVTGQAGKAYSSNFNRSRYNSYEDFRLSPLNESFCLEESVLNPKDYESPKAKFIRNNASSVIWPFDFQVNNSANEFYNNYPINESDYEWSKLAYKIAYTDFNKSFELRSYITGLVNLCNKNGSVCGQFYPFDNTLMISSTEMDRLDSVSLIEQWKISEVLLSNISINKKLDIIFKHILPKDFLTQCGNYIREKEIIPCLEETTIQKGVFLNKMLEYFESHQEVAKKEENKTNINKRLPVVNGKRYSSVTLGNLFNGRESTYIDKWDVYQRQKFSAESKIKELMNGILQRKSEIKTLSKLKVDNGEKMEDVIQSAVLDDLNALFKNRKVLAVNVRTSRADNSKYICQIVFKPSIVVDERTDFGYNLGVICVEVPLQVSGSTITFTDEIPVVFTKMPSYSLVKSKLNETDDIEEVVDFTIEEPYNLYRAEEPDEHNHSFINPKPMAHASPTIGNNICPGNYLKAFMNATDNQNLLNWVGLLIMESESANTKDTWGKSIRDFMLDPGRYSSVDICRKVHDYSIKEPIKNAYSPIEDFNVSGGSEIIYFLRRTVGQYAMLNLQNTNIAEYLKYMKENSLDKEHELKIKKFEEALCNRIYRTSTQEELDQLNQDLFGKGEKVPFEFGSLFDKLFTSDVYTLSILLNENFLVEQKGDCPIQDCISQKIKNIFGLEPMDYKLHRYIPRQIRCFNDVLFSENIYFVEANNPDFDIVIMVGDKNITFKPCIKVNGPNWRKLSNWACYIDCCNPKFWQCK